MKKYLFTIGLLSVMAVSCTMTEMDVPLTSGTPEKFYATIEDDPCYEGTKTFTDETLQIFWNKEDHITIFNNNTAATEFFFTGEDGDLGGDFDPCPSISFASGTEMDGAIFAVYPHQKDTKIPALGSISYTFPATQTFEKDHSFGRGANVMVAKTAIPDNNLRFKNVGGYLAFKLYGEDVSVSSVLLKANGGEPLAGKSTIDMTGDVPSISTMTETTNEIRLYCDKAVTLDASAENYTEFIFVLPPMTFSEEGFTLTVLTADGGVYTKTAAMSLEIERNKIKRMAPLKVTPTGSTNIKINSISSKKGSKTYDAVKTSDGTWQLTIPTETAFSNLVLSFTQTSGATLMANGKVLENGVTPVDASNGRQVELTVCKNNREKRFTLNVRNTGLPVVKITTTGEGFTLDKLESYKNSLQSSDKKDHRIWLPVDADDQENSSEYHADWSASVSIYNADGSAGMEGTTVETQIKGRGNYTWKWLKKPYALKFTQKREVLGMPSHKRWCLLANWRDRTLLRNDATFELSRRFGLPYSVRGQFVELEFNGEPRGNYYLCEQIKIDKNRVNITELKKDFNKETVDYSGGYLMEIDSYWDEVNKFKSEYFTLKYMFKEPDEDPHAEDFDQRYQTGYTWMENYINNLEKVLKTKSSVYNGDPDHNGDFNDLLDVDSAILFMLLNELSGNRDYFQDGDEDHYGPHSTYLYKDKGGKLFFGPGWDFDYETYIAQSYINKSGTKDGWRGFTQTGYYYHYMRYNPKFVERIKTLWNDTDRKTAIQGLPAYINQMAGKISLSQQYDEDLWPYDPDDSSTTENRNDNHDYYDTWNRKVIPFTTAISTMITNFNARVSWMDTKINALGTTNPTFLYEDPSEWPQPQED